MVARDTHPDKNPNDPTAKERFQDLQRAYDTLRDNLERSKYDEDNPYHGRDHERSSTSRAQIWNR
jgi:curved DNA-binding protein CbpA